MSEASQARHRARKNAARRNNVQTMLSMHRGEEHGEYVGRNPKYGVVGTKVIKLSKGVPFVRADRFAQ